VYLRFSGSAGEAVDGALFVAGRAVLFLLGYSGEFGGVVFGRHGYGAEEEAGEGGVLVEDGATLGVDVEEVERWCGNRVGFAAARGELGFDATEEELENGGFEGMEEEGQGWSAGEVEGEGVLFEETDGGECRRGDVGGVGGAPVLDVCLCGVGQGWVEFDADDLVEGEFAGYEHGAAFAGTDVDEGVMVDGMGRVGVAPEVDESAEDAGSDAVVGGDVGVVGVTGGEVAGGDEAAGFDAVDLVEGMLRRLRWRHHQKSLRFAWRHD
jgi:hypothetical protein